MTTGYDSHEIRTDAAPGLAPIRSKPRRTLCLRLKDIAYDFRVTLYYRVTLEHDIIER